MPFLVPGPLMLQGSASVHHGERLDGGSREAGHLDAGGGDGFA
jgi:hypothetical protein